MPALSVSAVSHTTSAKSQRLFQRSFRIDTAFRAMTLNEQKYPNPDEFKPERFLYEDGSSTSDTMPWGFGWDHRIFLATFSAQKTLDEHG
ncbi:hypothetical protein AZE42_13287 [Rhizopogon vesiculosus]|uniref:Uncharacterized protein n=1 Tax=Rhizopogon vesiculosus TaxID=180088 RepID=A0A1J8PSP2_9AGAM|nr:hypothetical protein AZE42_13287 [Rhizopogon vesiculosus]